MERLTLPREPKTVDAGKFLPAGDSLPSWSTLPLDAKFPMVPTPKGTLTLFTTKCCNPKYRRKSSLHFDLTDPNGMSVSSEYHPLHDPHLKAHFNVPYMQRHLVRNGFITDSGMVICNLKEFNKYRQYLRRICLMELMRERKKESQKDTGSSTKMGDLTSDDPNANLPARCIEARRRQIEKIEKQKLKMAMMAKLKGEQMERKRQEQLERQAESLKKRQEEDDRRRDTLMRNAEETERRNLSMLRKWRRRDRQHAMRVEDMRRQRVSDLQKKNKDSWEMRKRVQQDRLDREAEARKRVKEAMERDIIERDRYLMRRRQAEMAKLDRLKSSARTAREERERVCAARLARRIAAATRRAHRRYRDKYSKSPFQSEWTLQQVLRRLSFPELTRGSSHDLMQMLSAAIDEAVDRVTSQSDVIEEEEEEAMQRFAADLVESVVTKVRNEIYPAYLRLLGTEGEAEDQYDEMERPDTGTDDELNFDDNGIEEKGSRSVRFSFDEAIIPVSTDSLDVLGVGGLCLKPVSEHMLTPVPSPLPCDGSGSEFDFRVEGPSKPTKRESGLVESLLLRLLDDLNHGRLKREDLMRLTGYCIEVIKAKETRDKLTESPSGHVAHELVNFTLSKILDDIKSGSVSQDDLTALTQSIVKDAQNESGIEPDMNDDDLERLISGALSGALSGVMDDDDDHASDMMLENFVTRTLSQVKDDLEDNKLTEEELKEMASAIVSAVLEDVSQDDSLMAEEFMRHTIHQVLEDLKADALVGAVLDKVVTAIVSSYHTLSTKEEKSNSDVIEEFVTDVLTQVVDGIKAGQYTEQELMQMISAKKSLRVDTAKRVKCLIDSLLNQIEGGSLTEEDMLEIGNGLVETGRKLLASRGLQGVDPEKMTSTEIADMVVKDVIETIQGEMEDEDFEKEALKALAASFLKVKSNAPTVGSSLDPSYLSTMKLPSPTESSLATDVVLAAMDRITRDVTQRNIPVHMLSSIAFSLAPEDDDTPSIFISEEGLEDLQSSSLPQYLKITLMDITRLLRSDRVCYSDAKNIFSIILMNYLRRDAAGRGSSCISDEDSRMIEELIGETLNKVIRDVAADVSSIGFSERGSSVMSGADLEKFVWKTLHRIGQEASMESLVSRPSAPIQFKSHCSVDSQNIESLVEQTLVQVAQDISEGITSDSSLVDTRRDAVLSSKSLTSKIVGFVNSVLEELIVGLESGRVSKISIAQFMGDICPDQDFEEMEVEKLHRKLIQVMEDVNQKKTDSVYFHVIAEKFAAIKAHGKRKSVMTPELQMIGNILSNVNANVLTQFVQATLVAVLGGVQIPSQAGSITSLLKAESSVIARKVVDDLIVRIEKEISDGSFILDSSELARKYVDGLMSQIQGEIDSGQLKPDDTKKIKQIVMAQKTSSAEMSTVSGSFSAYVLHTLKSVVSELRLAQGPVSETGLVVDDFIYKHLQQVVDSLQQTPPAGPKEETPQVTPNASALITNVIHEAVAEMIVERVVKNAQVLQQKTEQEPDAVTESSSAEIAKLVLATLKHVLSSDEYSYSSLIARESSTESSGTETDQSFDSTPKQTDSDRVPGDSEQEPETSTGVSDVVAEVINQTIINIKEGKLSQDEMTSLARILSGDQKKTGDVKSYILEVLKAVKDDILSGVVNADNIESIAQQIATLTVDKKEDIISKESGRHKSDPDSSASVQSMVKEVLSHIAVSLSDEGIKSKDAKTGETSETKIHRGSKQHIADTNENKNVPSPLPDMTNASPDVINNLGDLSIRDPPAGGLEPTRISARNSFRSVIAPDTADTFSTSKTSIGACSVSWSQESGNSLETEIIANIKQSASQAAGSTKSLSDVKIKSSRHQTSDVTDAVVDVVVECPPKDATSSKSSSSDLKQKGTKKASRTTDKTSSKKPSTQAGKPRDNVKKSVAERGSKASVPAIQIDSCSSISNTSSRTRTSSSSSCTSSKQDARSKKVAKKQEAKDVPDVKVTEACGDAHSTCSEASQSSSQADVMKIKSVCGSHTTQVRLRDSQSDSSKD